MNAAVEFRNKMSSGFQEIRSNAVQEEIVRKNGLGLRKLVLRLRKVKVDVKSTDEISDRVLVFVQLLSHHSDKVLKTALEADDVSTLVVERDDSSR